MSVTAPERAERIELSIGGMTCAACANRIERKLNRALADEPLGRAVVNYATETAVITGLPDSWAPALIKAVERAGYTAEPVVAQTDPNETSAPDRARKLLQRLAVAAILTVPLGNLAIMLALVPRLRFPGWEWVCVALAIPVVFWAAWPFHAATLRNLRHRTASMDTLVSVGVLASFGWSVVSIATGGSNQPGFWLGYGVTPAGADAIYLEVAAAVTTFLLAGRYFEARARGSARDVMLALSRLAAKQVRLIDAAGAEQVIPADQLKTGDRFAVWPGERIAADGIIDFGAAAVDTAMMTGEPVPRELSAGDPVLGGMIVLTARLEITATRTGPQTQLAQMAALAEAAQARKANVQRLVDHVVTWFVPAVLLFSLLTLTVWLLLGHPVRDAFNAAVSVLIIACPCAMGLATPTALMVGIGRAGQLGIVIKGPDALEAAGAIDVVVIDKTGTLTTGGMQVTKITTWGGDSETAALGIAAGLEAHSEHPIGRALVAAANARQVAVAEASAQRMLTGRGAQGLVAGRKFFIGSAALLSEQGVPLPPSSRVEPQQTTAYLATPDMLIARFELSDQLEPSAAAGVAQLAALGLRTVLLTGDHPDPAKRIGAELGFDDVISRVLPTEKVAVIERLHAAGHRVAMVGDGINDAAAIAAADLGMAVVRGTDLAMKSADMILVRRQLSVIADAIILARATRNTIRGNLLWAFGYNAAAIPLAALGLLNPLIAGLAMSLSSVFVVGNSLRLRNQPRRRKL